VCINELDSMGESVRREVIVGSINPNKCLLLGLDYRVYVAISYLNKTEILYILVEISQNRPLI